MINFMCAPNKFGGNWTGDKLNIFIRYLDAYLTALKNQSFKLIYIDAFAGSGGILTSDNELLDGSAVQALSARYKFDHYYFVEKDPKNVQNLKEKIKSKFPNLEERITVYCGDANYYLELILNSIDWNTTRGLLFLDPYATQLHWSILPKIASTGAIDVWYLFPLGALNRMLANDHINEKDGDCIDRLLGDKKWRDELYRDNPQLSLFDNSEQDKKDVNKVRKADQNELIACILTRLKSVFPCVSEHPRIFRNSKNAALFLFCFAISNPSYKAQGLAKKIANHILKKN